MNTNFVFDEVMGVDRKTFEPVWVWNRVEEFGDYSVQIPVGEHQIIEENSNYLINRGYQYGGYSWEAMVRASISADGGNPDENIDWDSENATMVTYTKDEQTAALIASHAQKILTDPKHRDAMLAAAKDME